MTCMFYPQWVNTEVCTALIPLTRKLTNQLANSPAIYILCPLALLFLLTINAFWIAFASLIHNTDTIHIIGASTSHRSSKKVIGSIYIMIHFLWCEHTLYQQGNDTHQGKSLQALSLWGKSHFLTFLLFKGSGNWSVKRLFIVHFCSFASRESHKSQVNHFALKALHLKVAQPEMF